METALRYLGGNFTARYFANHLILPWGRRLVDSCKDVDDVLQAELKRVMELNQKPKSSAQAKKRLVLNSPRNEGIVKCVSRKCPSKNVPDMTNVGAFGICYKCGESEHFRCAGTKDEEKREIIDGGQRYICSRCLFKSSISIAFENNVPSPATTVALVNTVYECNLCEYTGDGKNKLATHMGDIHGKHPCAMCGKKFWLKTELDLHKNVVHVVKCSFCDDTFGNVLELNVHIDEKHEVSEVLLSDLDEISESTEPLALEELVRPALEFFMDNSEREICRVCGKEENSKEDIEEHMKTHSIREKHSCQICGKEENSKSDIEEHIKSHSPNDKIICEVCGKVESSKKEIEDHLKIHKSKCKICGKEEKTETEIEEHMKTHKSKCKICGKEENTGNQIEEHMKTHKSKCEICGKEENTGNQIEEHMKTHCIKCEQCKVFFETEILLEEHNKEQHKVDTVIVLGQTHGQEEQHEQPQQGHHGDTPVLHREAVQGDDGEDLRLEIVKLKKETQFWKNRFEQAQTSYNELDKELTDVRKSFEEELVETRSQFEKVKNELEHSKENNDLLKKMGKIIVEKFEIRNKPDVQSVPPKTKSKVAQHSDDSIEVIGHLWRHL